MGQCGYYIGLDIGGTKTNIGIIDENGEIIASKKVQTKVGNETNDVIVSKIICETKALIRENNLGDDSIKSIGMGIPGTVERKEGAVLFAPNLGWTNVPIKKMFSDAFDKPIYVGQDTEAAALGEYLYGAGKGKKDVVCITIGTGVGCGLVIGGKLYKGKYYTAGEFGHTIVEIDGLKCNCGKNGCLEAYASGTAILKRFKNAVNAGSKSSILETKAIDDVKSEDVFKAAKENDELSLSLINDAVDYLSMGITNLINLMCPEAVILSGGISAERELFIDPLIEKTYSRIYNLLVDKVSITTAGQGEYSPLIGAAMLFKDPLFNAKEVNQ